MEVRPIELELKKVGGSKGFVLPDWVCKAFGLELGDKFKLNLQKLSNQIKNDQREAAALELQLAS